MMTPRSRPPRGLFITLEGTEGCGKSTQAKLLGEHLRNQGYDTVETREPGGTPLAEKIRSLLLDRADEPVAPETEAFLVLAARRQHVAQVIEPALARGSIVLCDRFIDSTLAYQGYARGIDIATLERLNRLATHALRPDLTLVFDLPVSTGLARRRSAAELNRLDRESLRFHQKVRAGFLDLAKRHPTRIQVLSARAPKETVARAVARAVRPLLGHIRRSIDHTRPAASRPSSQKSQVRHAIR
ncbi:MAG: dTMP kinase [Nitrospira sp.]|nr:dTMP kinase [Nitrospira sp.]